MRSKWVRSCPERFSRDLQTVSSFTENVVDDPHARGGNERFDIEIRNSRDHPDPWGQPNVSVIIGGTREQTGVRSSGVAESVDPGNFARQETAVVMLDQASAPAGSGQRTINELITPETDVVALVGSVLGFVASHEVGHNLGGWHTQPNNGVVSIMDTFDITQLGLGPDLVFGTATTSTSTSSWTSSARASSAPRTR